MTYLFRRTNIYNYFLLFMLAFSLHGWCLFDTEMKQVDCNMLPGQQLMNFLYYIFPSLFAQKIFAIFFITGEAIFLNFILSKFEIINPANHLPALIFIMTASVPDASGIINIPLIVSAIFLFGIFLVFTLYKSEFSNVRIFEAGFVFGTAFMLYFDAVYFLIVFAVALSTLRLFTIRDLLLMLLGFLTPAYWIFSLYFFTDDLSFAYTKILQNLEFIFDENKFSNLLTFLPFIPAAFLFFAGSFALLQKSESSMLKIRKYRLVILLAIVPAIIIAAIDRTTGSAGLIYFAIPFSLFTSFYLSSANWGWWKELIVLSFAASIIYVQILLHYK